MVAVNARGALRVGGACALAGGAAMGAGFAAAPGQALGSYLVAFSYAVSIAVGSLFLLLIGRVAGASWMSVLGRVLESVALSVIPLAALFIPLAAGAARLYPWATDLAFLDDHTRRVLAHKAAYLNVPAFCTRSALYFAVWAGAALALRRSATRRAAAADDSERARLFARERGLAAVMLVLSSIAVTFAAFDWLMSLDPTWFSSMFGVYYFSGGFLGAIAAVTLLALLARRRADFAAAFTPNHLHALGRMLLGFTVFWAYAAYFQVFLISIADRPIELTFYLQRDQGSWRGVGYVLVLGHFALPFLLLLPRALKFSAGYLAAISLWLLLMHFLDLHWIVMPRMHPAGFAPHWMDLAAMLSVSGVCIACAGAMQRGRPLLDRADPLLAAGIRYASGQ